MSSSAELRFEPRHQLEAVQLRHPDVDNREVRVDSSSLHQGISGRPRSDHVMRRAEHTLDRVKHSRIVVDHENSGRSHTCCGCDCVAACGSAMSTRVPLPASLRIVIVPSTSQRMERQIERPRPLPRALVVKNGSVTRGRCSAGIPHPESDDRNVHAVCRSIGRRS